MSCYQKFYTNQIHSSSLLCQLATMWKSQVLCDAIIRTGPVVTKAHRVVLVAACPMLQSMENASMGSHLEVRLASDIKQDSINTFLQYLYEGFMMLTEENCKDVEKIARLLQVDSVTKCCMDFYKCLTVKTGQSHPGDQYKYTSYDMLEFRHVRSSDIQKTVHDRVMKRGSDFTRPSSPSFKRQKIHKPSSPSFEILSTSHRADDTLSMAHSYGGANPDPWDRVPRLGAGGRHNVSSQPGVIDIVEDSIEIIQTEQPEKDARGNVRSDSRMKQKSVSIAVSSQMNSVEDVQIVNVSDKNDTSSTKQNSNNTAPTTTTVSSSGRGSITVSPLAIFNNDTSNQTTVRDSSHFPKSQPQSSPEVQDAHFVHRSSDPSATSTPSQPVFPTSMSPISRPPAISQAKPYAAGSAQQAAMSPGESNSTAKGPRLQTSRIEQEKNTLSPASFEKGQENSSKVDSETPSISADKAPDISIVKIEQEEDNTGGLDMYVDIPEDGMMRIRRGMDDTEDGSDLEHDMMREEASNEGSNVSGDQNNSWYIGQFKGQDSDESLLDIGGDGGIGDSAMYASGAGDHVSDMETTNKVVAIFRGWLQEKGYPTTFEALTTEDLMDKIGEFYNDSMKSPDGFKVETLSMVKTSLEQYIATCKCLPEEAIASQLEPMLGQKDSYYVNRPAKVSKKMPMTIADIVQLHRSKLLSAQDPIGLFRKIWFDISVHLGCCGQDAMRQLHEGSFILESDESGRMYYRLNQDINDAKTRSKHEMQCWNWNGRMYEIPDDPNCPVKSLTLYLSKRNKHNKAFFQRHRMAFSPTDPEWYEAAPLGHCVLARIMSVMSEVAGLSKIYTNTSLRLTAAKFLDDYQLDTTRILGVHPRYKGSRSSEHPVEGEEAVNRICEGEEVSVNHIQWAIGLFRVWMKLRGEDPSFENLPAYRLNDFLCQFYEEIITDRSLAWFPVALNRHLTGPPFYRNIDILLNPAFETSNAILETKSRMFSVQLNDQHCDDASKISMTFGHLKTIYSSDILCCKDPTSLQNKVWMDVNLYFGGFTRQLLRNMKKTSFILNTDPTDGRMYYRMIDDNVSDKNTARMYEQPGNPFCPVQSIMMYLSKLHPDSEVFFQQPGGQEDLKRGMWYSCQPIGKNSHSSKLTVICKQIGINQQFRNTSLRHLSRYVHSKLPDYTPAYSDKIARILVGDDNDPLTWI